MRWPHPQNRPVRQGHPPGVLGSAGMPFPRVRSSPKPRNSQRPEPGALRSEPQALSLSKGSEPRD